MLTKILFFALIPDLAILTVVSGSYLFFYPLRIKYRSSNSCSEHKQCSNNDDCHTCIQLDQHVGVQPIWLWTRS